MTISLEEKNRDEIELMLKTMDIDWDAVVKVSTAHYVFPALYCNIKRADFLQYLPQELVILHGAYHQCKQRTKQTNNSPSQRFKHAVISK